MKPQTDFKTLEKDNLTTHENLGKEGFFEYGIINFSIILSNSCFKKNSRWKPQIINIEIQ